MGNYMRVAYADPPYIGQAKKHYNSEEVDHKDLINQLMAYDAWALSCSTPSLKEILSYCPSDVRVAAWVKPFCSFKPNVNPSYAWEPVIFYGSRAERGKGQTTVRDWVSANITLKRGLSGAKPEEFCYWLFKLLGMKSTDKFYDVFPGTGAVTKAWGKWCRQMVMELGNVD